MCTFIILFHNERLWSSAVFKEQRRENLILLIVATNKLLGEKIVDFLH